MGYVQELHDICQFIYKQSLYIKVN